MDSRSLGYPGIKPFQRVQIANGSLVLWGHNFTWIENGNYESGEHVGTHMDSPAHFIYGGWHVDEIPTYRLIGPAVKISVRTQAATNKDYSLTTNDVLAWESKHGRIPDGAILFLESGTSRFYDEGMKKYAGADQFMDENNNVLFHFPGFSSEVADFLVKHRRIVGVCVDAPSFDIGPSTTLPVHHIFLGNKIWAIENVADMTALPTTGSIATVYPMKIRGGSGAPTRVVAIKTSLHISAAQRSHLEGFLIASAIVFWFNM
ncbi:isatin hydrolase-like isoform X2 [Tubulanus polymorphus]